jgi:hypothetical protein
VTVQERNSEMVELLRPDFFGRYEPNASMVHAGLHLQLPQLRGYWPFSSVDENGDVYDLSGQGRVLTNNNTTLFNVYNLLPYADFTPASTHYFSRLDEAGLDITLSLTVGGWFWLDTLAPGNNMGLIGKYTGGGNQSYILYFHDASNTFRFTISANGLVDVTVASTASLAISTWYHIVGRFVPNTELSIFVDGIETLNAAGIPAGIFNGAADLQIGAYNAGTNLLDGRACQCFLCSDDLDDVIIKTVYEQTRANFGK